MRVFWEGGLSDWTSHLSGPRAVSVLYRHNQEEKNDAHLWTQMQSCGDTVSDRS